MTALVVPMAPVRNAVQQSQRLGMPETRQTVVNRIVADIRAGHHAHLVTPAGPLTFSARSDHSLDAKRYLQQPWPPGGAP